MLALARKYRPRRFADLLVQDHVALGLRGAVSKGRVGHGYLLTGPRGVGKTTAARILAMALNCERPDAAHPGEPCGECTTCGRIWSGGANLDVVEIDAASNRSVDDARDLRERAMYAASDERRYKVYIIDEAHMLTREAWNALLKILEEPPPRVVFVFATTEPQKIANTAAPVLSRLQRFDFKRIGPPAIEARLREVLAQEGVEADADALALIARYADGGMRDALSVLDQVMTLGEGRLTAERVRQALGLIGEEEYARVLAAVARHDAAAIFPLVDELMAAGADLVELMNGLAEFLRAILMTRTGAEPAGLTTRGRELVADLAGQLVPGDVLRMLALLTDAEMAIRRSASARLVVETLLLRWTLMDRTVDLTSVVESLGAPGNAGPSRPFVDPSRPAPSAGGGAGLPRDTRPPASSDAAGAPPAAAAAAPLTDDVSVAGLTAVWADLAARARQQSALVGTVIDALEPVGVDGDLVTVGVLAGHEHMAEGARRQVRAIQEILAGAVGRAIRLAVRDPGVAQPRPDRPKRLSDKDLKDEKLRELRGLDPALDAAADALDLEIVE